MRIQAVVPSERAEERLRCVRHNRPGLCCFGGMTGIQLDHTTLGLPLHLLESSEVLEQMELLYWNGPSALPASNMTLQPGQTPVPELDAGKHMKKTGKKRTYNRDMNATKRPETAFFRYLNEQRKHITTELR